MVSAANKNGLAGFPIKNNKHPCMCVIVYVRMMKSKWMDVASVLSVIIQVITFFLYNYCESFQ